MYIPRREKERDTGFAGHCSREHSLPSSRFTGEEHALWEFTAEFCKL